MPQCPLRVAQIIEWFEEDYMKKTRTFALVLVFLLAIAATGWASGVGGGEVSAGAAVPVGMYQEAPMLTDLVRAGTLPPVDERLPANPLVVRPLENVGKYGGTLVGTMNIPPAEGIITKWVHASLTYLDTDDMVTATPGLLEAWEFSSDFKTVTVHLREGTRWSDGELFTTDDILFAYEDVLLNENLGNRAFWKDSSAEAIDDTTMQFTFPIPRPHMLITTYGVKNNYLQDVFQDSFFFPRHYGEQFHIKYNVDAQETAEEEGFDDWSQLFHAKVSWPEHGSTNAEVPVLAPWKIAETTPAYMLYERNPYFWAVDTRNNQLPYIDKLMGVAATDFELRQAKALAGELDWADANSDLSIDILPELNDRADEINMKVWTVSSLYSNQLILMPPQTHVDPKMRELARNIDYRRALSLALDRDEINEITFLGTGTPQQSVPVPSTGALYWDDLANFGLEYDPDESSRLLDEVGLDNKNRQGFRTWPDGSDLKLTLYIVYEFEPQWQTMAELIVKQLQAVGLDVEMELVTYGGYVDGVNAMTNDLPYWSQAGGVALTLFEGSVPHTTWVSWFGYGTGWVTGALDDAPEWYTRSQELAAQAGQLPMDQAIPLLKQAIELPIKNYSMIGTIAQTPEPYARRANLRNVPETGSFAVGDYGHHLWGKPFTWYFE